MWDSWAYILTMDSENIVGNAKETLLACTENMLYLLHSFYEDSTTKKTNGRLLYLNDRMIIALGLTNISNVIVKLKAW